MKTCIRLFGPVIDKIQKDRMVFGTLLPRPPAEMAIKTMQTADCAGKSEQISDHANGGFIVMIS